MSKTSKIAALLAFLSPVPAFAGTLKLSVRADVFVSYLDGEFCRTTTSKQPVQEISLETGYDANGQARGKWDYPVNASFEGMMQSASFHAGVRTVAQNGAVVDNLLVIEIKDKNKNTTTSLEYPVGVNLDAKTKNIVVRTYLEQVPKNDCPDFADLTFSIN